MRLSDLRKKCRRWYLGDTPPGDDAEIDPESFAYLLCHPAIRPATRLFAYVLGVVTAAIALHLVGVGRW